MDEIQIIEEILLRLGLFGAVVLFGILKALPATAVGLAIMVAIGCIFGTHRRLP